MGVSHVRAPCASQRRSNGREPQYVKYALFVREKQGADGTGVQGLSARLAVQAQDDGRETVRRQDPGLDEAGRLLRADGRHLYFLKPLHARVADHPVDRDDPGDLLRLREIRDEGLLDLLLGARRIAGRQEKKQRRGEQAQDDERTIARHGLLLFGLKYGGKPGSVQWRASVAVAVLHDGAAARADLLALARLGRPAARRAGHGIRNSGTRMRPLGHASASPVEYKRGGRPGDPEVTAVLRRGP